MTNTNIDTSIFYTINVLLSYKRLYNLICGVRGCGKTYCTTHLAIRDAIKQKKITFVVIVRYKEDLLDIKNSWWVIVEHLFEGYSFYTLRKTIYCKDNKTGEVFAIGEFIPLCEYARAKRTPRPYVKWIIFDEFLNEDGDYLKNEVDKFLNICDSIIRLRDNVRVILISNTISILNPYFDYFGITRFNGRFTKGLHDSVIEFTDSEDFIKARKSTKFGKSVEDTDYGTFALDGRFMLDDMTNVMKPNGKVKYMYSIVLDDNPINVNYVNGIMYLSKNKDYQRKSFTPYVNDAKMYNSQLLDKQHTYFRQISKMFMQDKMIFETLKIKNSVINLVRFMMGNRYK